MACVYTHAYNKNIYTKVWWYRDMQRDRGTWIQWQMVYVWRKIYLWVFLFEKDFREHRKYVHFIRESLYFANLPIRESQSKSFNEFLNSVKVSLKENEKKKVSHLIRKHFKVFILSWPPLIIGKHLKCSVMTNISELDVISLKIWNV